MLTSSCRDGCHTEQILDFLGIVAQVPLTHSDQGFLFTGSSLGASPGVAFAFGGLTPGNLMQEKSVLREAFTVSGNKLGRGVQMTEVSL